MIEIFVGKRVDNIVKKSLIDVIVVAATGSLFIIIYSSGDYSEITAENVVFP